MESEHKKFDTYVGICLLPQFHPIRKQLERKLEVRIPISDEEIQEVRVWIDCLIAKANRRK